MLSVPTTIREALDQATQLLQQRSESARLDAQLIMANLVGVTRTWLLAHDDALLDDDTICAFATGIERRLAGEPVAYITGSLEFWNLNFAVGAGVLAPRPETELLVQQALQWLVHHPSAIALDVGTGSGAIILSLALSLPGHRGSFTGSDRSPDALQWAIQNRKRLGLNDRVNLLVGDVTSWATGRFDLILANLPYLSPAQVAGNPDLAAEPRTALDGGREGLDIVSSLIGDLPRVLAPGGLAILEIDPSQGEALAGIAHRGAPDTQFKLEPDFSGRSRFAILQMPDSASSAITLNQV